MAKITRIEATIPTIQHRKRVAAYARVSIEKGRTMHSLSAQVSYYNKLIQSNREWIFAGVYSDGGISGTTKERPGFQELLKDCEEGKIDLVLTKSISRFARNTVDLLNTVRHLKDLGIEVQFEKEHISSLSEDGELMLTLLASFAQEEVRSISNNAKWAVQKRFQKGLHNGRFRITGYRWEGQKLVIYEPEAELVRYIYKRYMEGASRVGIAKELNDKGITTVKGYQWVDSNVKSILTNITYTGNLLFQKEYTVDPITHKSKKNRGELPQYFVADTHEAIIPKDEWDKVQAEFKRRREAGAIGNPHIPTSCFTSIIKCSKCGYNYRRGISRRKNDVYHFWYCYGKDKNGKSFCETGNIPEEALQGAVCEVLGLDSFDPDVFLDKVDYITVGEEHELSFHLKSGEVIHHSWHYDKNARKACWTKERREKASKERRQKHLFNRKNAATPFTGLLQCGRCGNSFSSMKGEMKDGTYERYLSCRSKRSICPHNSIKESTLKVLVCDVLDLDLFDEQKMDAAIKRITVADETATFHFFDGHIETRSYHEKKKGYPWSKERHEKMDVFFKEYWADPEHRKECSERMKKIRKEKKWSSK